MSHNKLTNAEAKRLLEMIKKSIEDTIFLPDKGNKYVFDVEGDSKRDLFKIYIYRGKINSRKFNFSARVEKNGIVILELHINPGGKHTNPDGEIINGSHWHIYDEEHELEMAYLAEDVKNNEFIDVTMKFLDKFNVIERPNIQNSLE